MTRAVGLLLLVLWTSAMGQADEPAGANARVVLQTLNAAGLRHHDAKLVWEQLQVRDAVTLVRDASNPHDRDAVRLDWRGTVLGYIPQAENRFVARQLDRGVPLRAQILALGKYRNHRRRLEVEIFLPLTDAWAQSSAAPAAHSTPPQPSLSD